jgi:uncharacterized membrane protein
MRPPFYLRQLKRDLDTWIAQGLVPRESRGAILESVGANAAMRRFDVMLAILGAILIGAGAMSFVAANWAEMEKPARLLVLFGSLWASYGVAIWLTVTRREGFGQAFLLLGILLFGVNIWYVAQTYNINAHYPDGTLLWGLGALLAAALVPSRAALAAAIVLGLCWTWSETDPFNFRIFGPSPPPVLHLLFLPYWASCAFAASALKWRPGVHLSALALVVWLFISIHGLMRLTGLSTLELAGFYILLPLGLWCVAQLADADENGLVRVAGHYALFVFLLVYGLAFSGDLDNPQVPSPVWIATAAILAAAVVLTVAVGMRRKAFTLLDLAAAFFACVSTVLFVLVASDAGKEGLKLPHAAATLLVILWSLSRGVRTDDRFVINLAMLAFGVWFLYAYFILFSGLLNQALFFMIGGVLLVGLGLGLENTRRRLIKRTQESGAAS